MNKLITIISIISCVSLLNSCKPQQMSQYPPSDISRNTEESKKTIETTKVEVNSINDFGKPGSR
ncbi:hypothetical protein [Epilithonimonas xixisoli]|uniref:Uncharacterized protein n=1 Tax=Epilithonimonas xixisoli TaxID=1476462 RepID=A0A4R8I5K4_9FLAO|nr:hypothetical protein [Epilithonimonas xixisoli]TDX84172.1 hypothetical protein B0I22_1773 [Epilithonimonas xixisoli]